MFHVKKKLKDLEDAIFYFLYNFFESILSISDILWKYLGKIDKESWFLMNFACDYFINPVVIYECNLI